MPSITNVTSGTQTATINTEHTLSTQTTADVFVLAVNVTNNAAADILELRAKTKVLTGGSAVEAVVFTITGVQTEKVVWIEVPSEWSCEFTLKQTAGTGRSYEWSIAKAS